MSPNASPYFPGSYDSTAKIVSGVVAAVLIAATFGVGNPYVAGLGALILAVAYAWSPRGYSVAERSVVVHRLIGRVRIPLDAVREARRTTSDDFLGCIRLFGSGGLFGYWGLFRTTKLGKSSWYLTHRDGSLMIGTGEKTYLVSPDAADQFLAAIRATVSIPIAPPSASYDGATRPTARAGRFLITALVIGAGAAFASFAVLYSPGPPSYSLTPKSLVIHDRFYPVTLTPLSVDVVRVHVINLDSDREWAPVERTNGFANAHYRSGHFRVANGEEVRLYQAHARRLVLIPPLGKGTAVLLETRNPDAFAAELKRTWSGPLTAHPPEH